MNTYLTRYYNRDTDTRNNLLLFKVSQSKYCLTGLQYEKTKKKNLSGTKYFCHFMQICFSAVFTENSSTKINANATYELCLSNSKSCRELV